MLLQLAEFFDAIKEFLASGGAVLSVIVVVLFFLWTLILERLIYLNTIFPKEARLVIAQWDARQDTTSWHAQRIREAWVSEASRRLRAGIPLIKTLVMICPMLGLLGTVLGMIEVFTALSFEGTGNPRSMASGISKATIPTMAGMVAALSGVFMCSHLEQSAEVKAEYLADAMPRH